MIIYLFRKRQTSFKAMKKKSDFLITEIIKKKYSSKNLIHHMESGKGPEIWTWRTAV